MLLVADTAFGLTVPNYPLFQITPLYLIYKLKHGSRLVAENRDPYIYVKETHSHIIDPIHGNGHMKVQGSLIIRNSPEKLCPLKTKKKTKNIRRRRMAALHFDRIRYISCNTFI